MTRRASCLAGQICALMAGLVFLSPLACATESIFLLGNSAVRRSLAGAGVASPHNTEWMALNPAGLVALERRIDIDLATLHTDILFEPRGPVGNRFDGSSADRQFFFVPSAGMVFPTDHGAWALGIYSPSGIGVDLPHSRNLLSRLAHGNADRRLNIQQTRLQCAYAHRFDNGWALGASVNASLSLLRTDHLTLRLTSAEANHAWDTALGGGFGLGVWREWDRIALGLSYQSRQWSERFDKYTDLCTKSFDLPEIVQAGFAYDLTPNLQIMADYKFIHCNSIRVLSGPPLKGGFGRDDQHIAKLALEWRPAQRWSLRAGYSHNFGDAISDKYAFINALVGTISEDHLAFGASYAVSDRSDIHVSYMHTFDETIVDSGRGDLFSRLGAGTTMSLGVESVTLGYTYKF